MAYTTIDKPSSYFNSVLYTGTGSARTITGVGFQPDWVWVKDRTSANYHYLYDVLRGNNLNLFSNDTSADVNVTTGQNGGGVGSQASDGFTIVAGNVNTNNVNTNTNLYASWNWLANGAGVSNTAGTISSTVSANTTSGFSIVSYTGNGSSSATVGHGLGVTPALVIIKPRDALSANGHWYVKHKSLASNNNIFLNLTNATTDVSGQSAGGIGNLSSSSTFGFVNGTSNISSVNVSSGTYIAYCFAEVKGYSKFGSYVGNGSTDGTFIYTGFKPAFFLCKRSDAVSGVWFMFDNKRNTFNIVDKDLYPNTSDAEATADRMDFLSNGFKCRSTSASLNASGGTYIYMAFAENPFVSSKGLPCTAR